MRRNIIKRMFAALMALTMLSALLVSCGSKQEGPAAPEGKPESSAAEPAADEPVLPDNATPAQYTWYRFQQEIRNSQDLEKVAAAMLSDTSVVPFEAAVMPVEEGYLNGFANEEILGFRNGVMFGPVIGSIPFIGYIFETDDVDALKTLLQDNADLRWNICTEADEMLVDSVDNYVFFVMAPNTWDE